MLIWWEKREKQFYMGFEWEGMGESYTCTSVAKTACRVHRKSLIDINKVHMKRYYCIRAVILTSSIWKLTLQKGDNTIYLHLVLFKGACPCLRNNRHLHLTEPNNNNNRMVLSAAVASNTLKWLRVAFSLLFGSHLWVQWKEPCSINWEIKFCWFIHCHIQ